MAAGERDLLWCWIVASPVRGVTRVWSVERADNCPACHLGVLVAVLQPEPAVRFTGCSSIALDSRVQGKTALSETCCAATRAA